MWGMTITFFVIIGFVTCMSIGTLIRIRNQFKEEVNDLKNEFDRKTLLPPEETSVEILENSQDL